jgi:hypothetical protein
MHKIDFWFAQLDGFCKKFNRLFVVVSGVLLAAQFLWSKKQEITFMASGSVRSASYSLPAIYSTFISVVPSRLEDITLSNDILSILVMINFNFRPFLR